MNELLFVTTFEDNKNAPKLRSVFLCLIFNLKTFTTEDFQ